MAYIDCKLKSQLLQRTVAVKLYFPTDLPAEVGNTAVSYTHLTLPTKLEV